MELRIYRNYFQKDNHDYERILITEHDDKKMISCQGIEYIDFELNRKIDYRLGRLEKKQIGDFSEFCENMKLIYERG